MNVAMNASMEPIWAGSKAAVNVGKLHPDLRALLLDGLVLIEGGLFFAVLHNGPAVDAKDLTGEEASVNKLYLDEFVDLRAAGWAEFCVGQGVLLARAVLEAAAALTPTPVDILISADLGAPFPVGDQMLGTYPSSTFRFYCRRPDNLWTTEDLTDVVHPVARLRLHP